MRKILLSSAALCGLVMSSPALAQDGNLELDLGGWYKGYGVYIDQDEVAGSETKEIDWLQDTEIHLNGETTLDNGLTVGVHFEALTDSDDGFAVDESYAYFSGAWGRVNAGTEDGAAYLLQVAAPSADSNIDGIRQYVQPVNYTAAGITVANGFADLDGDGTADLLESFTADGIDYDNDFASSANKITYLTPVFSGFQAGVSFTPDVDGGNRDLDGVNLDDVADSFGEAYEGAVRYEGQWDALGFALGGGYTHAELEDDGAVYTDDFEEWNVGADVNFGPFGLGAVYTENNGAVDDDGESETIVVGADYTTGPFKLGASWYNNDLETGPAAELETDRYTGGVVYTYGPGMTFRGSISYIDHEVPAADDIEATSFLLGTQINF